MHRVFFGHHKAASRFFRLSVFTPIARANGWEVVSYKVRNPPFHFSELPDLDLHNIDFARLADPRPVVVNLLNSSPAVVCAVDDAAPDYRGLHVVRDPRAMLVSAYFHHRDTHPTSQNGWFWDKLAEDQPVLRSLPVEDGLLYELDNITRRVLDRQMKVWTADDRILEVRAEDVRDNPDQFVKNLAVHLEIDTPPAVRWLQTYSDSGASGWLRYFTPRVQRAFNERYGDWLDDLGYEPNGFS